MHSGLSGPGVGIAAGSIAVMYSVSSETTLRRCLRILLDDFLGTFRRLIHDDFELSRWTIAQRFPSHHSPAEHNDKRDQRPSKSHTRLRSQFPNRYNRIAITFRMLNHLPRHRTTSFSDSFPSVSESRVVSSSTIYHSVTRYQGLINLPRGSTRYSSRFGCLAGSRSRFA